MSLPPNESSAVILWLTPAGFARDFFRETIERLALERDAPIFEPHLTLGLGSPQQIEHLRARPFQLRVLGLGWSEEFTRTLFVSFDLSPELAQLRDSLGMAEKDFEPHLSLLYKEMRLEEKKQLARSISLPFACATFDAISAIRCPAPTTSRADVDSWQTIATKSLGEE